MYFEFDSRKSASNKIKHDIDFTEIQVLWKDAQRLTLPSKQTDEFRQLVIGKVKGKLWTAIITHRGENIRIISARRSRNEEKKLYEKKDEKNKR